MKIIDKGHKYELTTFDNDNDYLPPVLFFVKRIGEMYPGNEGVPSQGTNVQEVCRVLIDRLKYVNNQIPDLHNDTAIGLLRGVIYELEERAAKRHGRILSFDFVSKDVEQIELIPICPKCGHIECNKHKEAA